ncbi:MAG: T9SS type A sorting domain-containing protein [bacterium]
MKKVFILSSLVISIFLCANALHSQTTGLFTMDYTYNGVKYPISFYVPEDYSANQNYPMIFGWHGNGMPGTDMVSWLYSTIGQKEKIILVCPDIAGVTDGTTLSSIINAALQYTSTTYKIDPGKMVVSGFSMGGGIAYQLGLQNPTLFKGIIGMSPAIGSGDFTQTMWDNIKSIRMATIDGDKDVNYQVVNTLMTDIKNKGGNLLYIVKPGVEHADQTYFSSQEYFDDYKRCWDYIFGNVSVEDQTLTDFNINIFPNPITEWANVSYSIENQTYLTITIQNSLGEVISTAVNNQLVNSGNYTDLIETRSLLPGVYFCTIKTDFSSETKKFVVVK